MEAKEKEKDTEDNQRRRRQEFKRKWENIYNDDREKEEKIIKGKVWMERNKN